MRKRNIQIIIRLDKEEHRRLCKLVKKSGLSQEAYLRHLINGVVPNDAPPPDYFSMMKELHGIGNNLNQIAQKAHILNVIDVQRYDENMRLFNQAIRKITNAVTLPRKAGAPQSPLCGEKERPRSGGFLAASGENDKRSVP
jgi:hypothetical protein